MISINRVMEAPVRLDLSDPESAASIEYNGILASLQQNGSPAIGTKFNAYANKSVRQALQDMFHNKCAYCESQIAGAQDTDVEHYRPKGSVLEAKGAGIQHPGYWWLAMEWTNLVLSCMHCNQRRRQLIVEAGMTKEEVQAKIEADRTVSTGKLDSFPTENSEWAMSHHDDITIEKPLLIDPTRVDPSDHIEWVLNEDMSTLRPRNNSLVGETSINTYGLNRRRLTEDRMKRLLLLRISGNKVLDALNKAVTSVDDAIAHAWESMAQSHIEALRAHCSEDQPFAGLARAYLAELGRIIETIKTP